MNAKKLFSAEFSVQRNSFLIMNNELFQNSAFCISFFDESKQLFCLRFCIFYISGGNGSSGGKACRASDARHGDYDSAECQALARRQKGQLVFPHRRGGAG